MGVAQGCPLAVSKRPTRCKFCPLSEEEKRKKCSWYMNMQNKVWSRWISPATKYSKARLVK